MCRITAGCAASALTPTLSSAGYPPMRSLRRRSALSAGTHKQVAIMRSGMPTGMATDEFYRVRHQRTAPMSEANVLGVATLPISRIMHKTRSPPSYSLFDTSVLPTQVQHRSAFVLYLRSRHRPRATLARSRFCAVLDATKKRPPTCLCSTLAGVRAGVVAQSAARLASLMPCRVALRHRVAVARSICTGVTSH